MAGEFGGGGFLGGIGAILGGIASFVNGFIGITVRELLRLVKFLKDGILDLSKALLTGVWRLGRALARALVAFARLAGSGLKQFLLWANRKLVALEGFLKDKFAPILRFLKNVKDHIDDIYRRFIRPIIDTIEFIRQLNRILQVFHIGVLGKLDTVLQQIEKRIEDPFLWVRSHITEIENWINRIVTLDGLFQKVTLIRSMARYAPAWINVFWTKQVGQNKPTTPGAESLSGYPPHQVLEDVNALDDFFLRGEGDHAAVIRELSLMLMEAARTTPEVRG